MSDQNLNIAPLNSNNHPLHPLRILYAVIALFVVIGSVVYYQRSQIMPVAETPKVDPYYLSPEQEQKLVDAMNKSLEGTKPLTKAQEQAIVNRDKSNSTITTLSEEEMATIVKNLNNK